MDATTKTALELLYSILLSAVVQLARVRRVADRGLELALEPA